MITVRYFIISLIDIFIISQKMYRCLTDFKALSWLIFNYYELSALQKMDFQCVYLGLWISYIQGFCKFIIFFNTSNLFTINITLPLRNLHPQKFAIPLNISRLYCLTILHVYNICRTISGSIFTAVGYWSNDEYFVLVKCWESFVYCRVCTVLN